jgi:hypothetical protein
MVVKVLDDIKMNIKGFLKDFQKFYTTQESIEHIFLKIRVLEWLLTKGYDRFIFECKKLRKFTPDIIASKNDKEIMAWIEIGDMNKTWKEIMDFTNNVVQKIAEIGKKVEFNYFYVPYSTNLIVIDVLTDQIIYKEEIKDKIYVHNSYSLYDEVKDILNYLMKDEEIISES